MTQGHPGGLRLTWAQALAWRMERHGITRRARRDAALEVAGRICGLHAQVMSSAGGRSRGGRVDARA